jgi:hypothetical protein
VFKLQSRSSRYSCPKHARVQRTPARAATLPSSLLYLCELALAGKWLSRADIMRTSGFPPSCSSRWRYLRNTSSRRALDGRRWALKKTVCFGGMCSAKVCLWTLMGSNKPMRSGGSLVEGQCTPLRRSHQPPRHHTNRGMACSAWPSRRRNIPAHTCQTGRWLFRAPSRPPGRRSSLSA